ncbi:MAG: addiction module protein [Bacteroidota bacterium]
MSKNFENVFQQAQELTRSEQLALIASIAQLIGEEDGVPEYAIRENNRRLQAYDAGEVEGIPYKEALDFVRKQMDAHR